jgi:hypothetical protein
VAEVGLARVKEAAVELKAAAMEAVAVKAVVPLVEVAAAPTEMEMEADKVAGME